MRVLLLSMLWLSVLLDVVIGGWMMFGWNSFAPNMNASANAETSVLGFTIGLLLLAIAGVAAVCALWSLANKREGLLLSLFFGVGLIVFGIVISLRTASAFNLLLDSLRGALIAVPSLALLRQKSELNS